MSSSPWNIIEKIETENFSDIMSNEMKSCKKNKEINNEIFYELKEPDDEAGWKEGVYQIPDEVFRAIEFDEPIIECDSDEVIAKLLQKQFDQEYDAEVKRVEKHVNKDSKVGVSYRNYMMLPEELVYDDDDDDTKKKSNENPIEDWDKFESNEKKFSSIPKSGYMIDSEGEMITKHNSDIAGVRNACRVMSFPPEILTGDGFDIKLSNSVYNQLKTYSQSQRCSGSTSKKHKMHDRRENVATTEMGIDEQTRLILYKFINNQILDSINGIISTGKEAVILHGYSDPNYSGPLIIPKECAIKIFKTTLNEFKQRDRYIKDDYRFKERFSKQNKRQIINMWAEKEMHNLMRMNKANINCPNVVTLKKHILVMSFIGTKNLPAPKLKDAQLTNAEWDLAYNEVIDMMTKLYNNAKLVHADLSEYNILWYDEKCWFIDVAQSIEPNHPSALEYFMRDCNNISTFFTNRGVKDVKTKEELFSSITLLDPITHNTSMLERMHIKGPTIDIATRPNNIDYPDELKSLVYPFDYAWNKVNELKRKEKEAAANILDDDDDDEEDDDKIKNLSIKTINDEDKKEIVVVN